MKKMGIKVLSILLIASVFIVSSAMVVNAAPPRKIFVTITDIQEGEMQVSFNWNKLGVWKYRVDFRKDGQTLGNTGVLSFSSRTPQYSGSYNYTSSNITCGGHTYTARIITYNKSGRFLKHGITQDSDQLYCPP